MNENDKNVGPKGPVVTGHATVINPEDKKPEDKKWLSTEN